MEKDTSKNIRVGLFVIIGTLLIIFAFYFIGSQQNLFGRNFRVSANFNNVNGLQSGNNVRFGGIDVGTVERVEITSDSTIKVIMIIENSAKEYIKKNALVSIGTDGLMGNKLININSVNRPSQKIADGDVLIALRPIETDEMLRTLNRTNEDMAAIAHNLKMFSEKVNKPNSLWSILMDTVVSENIKQSIVSIKTTSNNTAIITGDLSRIVKEVKAGKGSIGALLTDDSFVNKLDQTIVNIKIVTDSLALISGDLRSVSQKIKKGEGAIGTVLMDTTFVHDLKKSMENIKSGTKGFDDNMKALKSNIFLRSYFKKQEKMKSKEQKSKN